MKALVLGGNNELDHIISHCGSHDLI